MKAFARVRASFLEKLDTNLGALGVKVVGGQARGGWRQIVCPLCSDTNGSCDVAVDSGYLRCKQCNQEMELFSWVASVWGCANTWEACKKLAETLGVSIEIAVRRGKPPKEMTEEVLGQAVHKLWTEPAAEPCRELLRNRSLANPEILSSMGIGWLAGSIIFAQYLPSGQIKPRYRKYTPGAPSHVKWLWSRGSGTTQGLWPVFKPPKDAKVILLEGEWDTLTAWVRLLWHRQGIFAYTWTGGVKAISPSMLPTWIKNRTVEICWDNDVFQGPRWADHKAPNDRKRVEMGVRRQALLATAKSLEMYGCRVALRAIPIDPVEKWGADFRDWVDAGGRDWEQIPRWSLANVLEADKPKPVECGFSAVYQYANAQVAFPAVVSTLEEDGISIPLRSQIECDMGAEAYCERCLVPKKFPGQVIDHEEHPTETAAAVLSQDPERVYRKELLGVPSQCNFVRVLTKEYKVGSRWTAVQDDTDEVSDKELVVVSEQSPTLSGEIKVHGTAHHHRNNIVVMASNLEMRESMAIDLREYAGKLKALCPWDSNDPDVIDKAIKFRADDLAKNVTHIYGRIPLHIAAILLAHSVIYFEVEGHKKRGWLDIAVIGDTSTGKSMTFRNLFDFHRLGKIHTCMENVSRAGLTMGATAGRGNRLKLKPGLFPRAHRKMLVLDEYHIMVEERTDHPMLHLQSARDQGHVGGIKIYGSRQLPAAVRLATLSNWFGGRRDTRKFPCEHLLDLYGKPESLRRLDFAIMVDGEPIVEEMPETQEWTVDIEQATILRAWGQEQGHVRITEEAMKFARQKVKEWGSCYAEELPLFTGEEKLFSLLRVAIATANTVFSHESEDLKTCVVRLGHIRWAVKWFEQCWAGLSYDQYSAAQFAKREVKQPLHVEAYFTAKLNIESADAAMRLLDCFFGQMSIGEISAYTGMDTHKTLAWASELVRLGALERGVAKNPFNSVWRLTPGAHRLLKAVIDFASDFPEEFHQRMQKMAEWAAVRGMAGEVNLTSVDLELEKMRDEWNASDRETNIFGGPGSA